MSFPVISSVVSVVSVLLTLLSRELKPGTNLRTKLCVFIALLIVSNAVLNWVDRPVETLVRIFYQDSQDKHVGDLLKTALDGYNCPVGEVRQITDVAKWSVFMDNEWQIRFFYKGDIGRADLVRLIDVSVSAQERQHKMKTKFERAWASNATEGTIEIWIPALRRR
jgi:hypothetical protein